MAGVRSAMGTQEREGLEGEVMGIWERWGGVSGRRFEAGGWTGSALVWAAGFGGGGRGQPGGG